MYVYVQGAVYLPCDEELGNKNGQPFDTSG